MKFLFCFVKKALPDLGVGLGLKYSVPNVT